MTPLPGPPPGNAHPGNRPTAPAASAARRFLVALLLAVLTVSGGAPLAAGAAPVRATAALGGSAPAAAPGLPVRTAARTPAPAPASAAPRTSAAVPVQASAPVQATAPVPAFADRGLRTEQWTAAEHPRTPHQPPGPGALLPAPPGVPLPPRVLRSVGALPQAGTGRPRIALPGVRGPPGTGPHRSRDLSQVPPPITAVPSSPS